MSPSVVIAYSLARGLPGFGFFPDSFAVAFSGSIKFVLWRDGELIAGGGASRGRGLTDTCGQDIVRDQGRCDERLPAGKSHKCDV